MKGILLSVLIVILGITCANGNDGKQSTATSENTDTADYIITGLTPENKKFVESLFANVAKQAKPGDADVPILFARQFLGLPYVAHTLDKTDDERMVILPRQLDCTTFVENVTALTICFNNGKTSFDDYVRQMTDIRYRQGKVGYEQRLHYYQWWVEDNEAMGFVKEIDCPVPPFTGTQKLKINYMSNNFNSYDMLRHHPERVKALLKIENATNGKVVKYIPKSETANNKELREVVHNGDIIAIVTSKTDLDTSHLGIAVWHDDGLHMIHASMKYKKVIEDPLLLHNYLAGFKTHLGVRIAKIL